MNMKEKLVKIYWPNGNSTYAPNGKDWISTAKEAKINIPTGCLRGSCGSCEIEVNGEVIRACISYVQANENNKVEVSLLLDENW